MKLRNLILLGVLPTLALSVILLNQSLLVGKGKPPKDPPPPPPVPAIFYEIQLLGTFGGNTSAAYDINKSGEVVGFADTSDLEPHAFVYSDRFGGTFRMVDLNKEIDPASGWILEYAQGINNLGEIVGEGLLNGKTRAFRFSPPWTAADGTVFAATIVALPVPADSLASSAMEINEHGDISGMIEDAGEIRNIVRWDASGQTVVLGTPFQSGPIAINDSREVAATLGSWPKELRAFRFDPTSAEANVDIGLLGIATEECYDVSIARDLNNAGTVVGQSTTDAKVSGRKKRQTVTCGPAHAFRYTDANGVEDLGTLGGEASYAWGINNSGDIVGISDIDPDNPFLEDVFLYTETDLDGDGQMEGMISVNQGIINMPADLTDLNSPLSPEQINNSLEICGQTAFGEAFILRPVQS